MSIRTPTTNVKEDPKVTTPGALSTRPPSSCRPQSPTTARTSEISEVDGGERLFESPFDVPERSVSSCATHHSVCSEVSAVLSQAQECERAALSRLATPRTSLAMVRLGILPQDLELRSLESFNQVGLLEAAQLLRFNHYEVRRQERLQEVLAERARVLEEQLSLDTATGSTMGELQSMERLLDEESRRLEMRLRHQVQASRCKEKVESGLLEKEKSLREKQEYADQRREAAQREKQTRAQRVRQNLENRHRGAAETKLELDAAHEVRQAEYEQAQIQTQEKLRRLQEEKGAKLASRADRWSARREQMKERKDAKELSTAVKAQLMRDKWQDKLSQVGRKKEEQIIAKTLAAEEHYLRMLDAQERAARAKRADEFRREQQRQELLSQQSRVTTMQELKAELLEQRAARARKLAAEQGRRTQQVTPGPADYVAKPSCLDENPGRTIARSSSVVPGTVEYALKRSKSLPPPGSYDPRCLRSGDAVGPDASRPGGALPKGPKPSAFVDASRRGIPGPGAYETNTSTVELPNGVRMQPAVVGSDWVLRDDGPGPAAYVLDPSLRERRLRKEKPGVAKALKVLQTSSAFAPRARQ